MLVQPKRHYKSREFEAMHKLSVHLDRVGNIAYSRRGILTTVTSV